MRDSNTLAIGWDQMLRWLASLPDFFMGAMDTWQWPVGLQPVVWLAMLLLSTGVWSYGFRSSDLSRRMRGLLLGLRSVAVAVLVWMLLGPAVWSPAAGDFVKPEVILLGDVSLSMKQKDVADYPDQSRWQTLEKTWLAPDYLARLQQWASLHPYHFDKGLRAATNHNIEAGSRDSRLGTNLFGALDRAVGGVEADAATNNLTVNSSAVTGGMVLLLSDGHDTQRASDPALLARLNRKNWSISSVAVGSDHRTADIALLAWADSDFVLQGQRTTLHASITQHGFDGQTARVDLLHEGQRIDSRTVKFSATAQPSNPNSQLDQLQVDFEIEPQSTGRRPLSVQGYQIAIQPLEGEQYTDNNRRWVFLQVSREQIRIALFEGQPYWDTRFLAQNLGNDAGVELAAMYGMGAGRELTTHHAKAQSLPTLTLPLSDEQLARYDIIILGRSCEQFFPGPAAQLLVDFVRKRGGALILARGKAFDTTNPLGAQAQAVLNPIEPVQWGSAVADQLALEMAPAGRRSPLLEFNLPEDTDTILTRLPDMLAATRIVQEKAASVVLLTQNAKRATAQDGAAGMAALVHQNAGAGQVLAVLSDGMWQWAFLPGELRRYDSVYQQFWSRTIRWLATGGQFLPGQSVSLTLSRLSVEPGDEVTAVVAARHIQGQLVEPRVNVIAPDGSSAVVALGMTAEQSNRWEGRFKPTQPGVYVVELLTPGMEPNRSTTRLAVYDQSVEVLDPSARPMTLQTLSAATDGKSYTLADRELFLHDLQQIALAQKADRQLQDAYDQPVMLLIFMLALSAEWLLRRRRGLL